MDLFNLHDGVSVVVGAQEQTPLILVPVKLSHLSLSCQGRIGQVLNISLSLSEFITALSL
jgi:hypothetical protein